jgi:hypothetical protein
VSIFNKRIFPDQQFSGLDPVQSGPRAVALEALGPPGAVGGSDMPPEQVWDPEADVIPPLDSNARLYVPMRARVPSSPPPRIPKIEPPADLIFTRVETVDHDLHASLAFPAHSVLIDNYSNMWLWLPAARRWVPPYFWGMTLPLYQATEIAEYFVQAPPTFTQGTLHATQYVTTMWTAALQVAQSGIPMPGGIA